MEQILTAAKALVAAVLLAVVQWLNTEHGLEWWAGLAVAVIGAVVVWLVPNATTNKED